jgi:ornithine cyclodeaminase/alanine dehydrogenase
MVGALPEGAGGVKLLTDTPENSRSTRPTQQSTIVLVNTATGACEAFLDGAAITAYRTAAASAVATKYLARTGPAILGFVGAGALARAHLLAIRCVRPVTSVLVWSRSSATAAAFAAFATEQGAPTRVLSSAQGVVEGADIVCTLTPSPTPVVKGEWFRPGLHLNAVGSPPRADYREIDTEGIRRSRVVVDSVKVVSHKSGDLLIPLAEQAIDRAHFSDELGQLVTHERPGRAGDHEITLYKSVGLAVQDIATARLVVAAARQKGLGTDIVLSK